MGIMLVSRNDNQIIENSLSRRLRDLGGTVEKTARERFHGESILHSHLRKLVGLDDENGQRTTKRRSLTRGAFDA